MELELKNKIERLPRVRFANLPTPLEEMPRLSERLGGPRIWIKRDDLTGLVFGGNKVRKLEFEMAEALNKKADVIVTSGALQSNHAFATLAAARKLGLRAILLLRGEEPDEYNGNLLLDRIFGAEIRFIRAESHETMEIMRKTAEELRNEGHNPYVIPFSSPLGSVGYVNAFLELISQARDRGINVDYIIHAAGSGGTQAGLVVGNKALKSGVKIIGIATESNSRLINVTGEIANKCAQLLGLDPSIGGEDITISTEFVGAGYGVVTEEIKETIRLVAETEGILLDPVYTAKAMTGLIKLVKRGFFKKDENVVFIHTGGLPAIFAHKEHFQPKKPN